MGLIDNLFGPAAATKALGEAATGVAEVFIPNATKKMQAAHDAYMAALDEHGEEFKYASPGLFDRFVNGLNRLPRPMLALGTLGLFVYAMIDPVHFAERMIGLNYVPEPLWWLLAAIVGFYFGAREAHYLRGGMVRVPSNGNGKAGAAPADGNPALDELRSRTTG